MAAIAEWVNHAGCALNARPLAQGDWDFLCGDWKLLYFTVNAYDIYIGVYIVEVTGRPVQLLLDRQYSICAKCQAVN